MTVEREISSIETANINKETLDAMKNASTAMKQIHGGMTIDKVDSTMYEFSLFALSEAVAPMFHTRGASPRVCTDQSLFFNTCREELRDQHAISEEINEALQQGAQANAMDEDELDEELQELQQEQLDNKMLDTGNVPVGDRVQKMPTPARSERECLCPYFPHVYGQFALFGLFMRLCSHTLLTILQSTNPPRKTKTRRKSSRSYRQRWPCEIHRPDIRSDRRSS